MTDQKDRSGADRPGSQSSVPIEEHSRLLEKLAQRSRLFEATLSAISDFAYSFDREGRFTYVNKALLDLWGLKLEDALGKNFYDLKYPDDLAAKLHKQIQQVLDTRCGLSDETPYTSPTGKGGYYEYIFSPVIDATGAVEAVAGSTRDITARKQTEAALRHNHQALEAANKAKDQFLAVLSHELRTPLSPVVMTLAAMELHPELPYELREDVAMIRRNIDLETKLIDDLLDLSRVTSGKLRLQMQPTQLHQVLRHTYEVCGSDINSKQLSVKMDFQARNDNVIADPARLEQVFWNLLKNAIKFSSDRGKLIVKTSNPDPNNVTVEVIDAGVGIPADVLNRIFDAFEQGDTKIARQFGGLGLGLAISKAVVDMHGGSISAISDGPGTGATFIVQMQAATPSASPKDAPNPAGAAPVPSAHARILLVEDHHDTARMMARLLATYGYQIKVTGSVAAALEAAGQEKFDLLVSDIGLPDGTGYELMQKLKNQMQGIALTGYGMEDDMRRGREAGFADHIVKPVNINQLESLIRQVLGKNGGAVAEAQ